MKSWVLKVVGTWIGWEVVSWALLFVQSCKPTMQTLKEVANVLLDERCNFLTLFNVYLSWTACLFLMLSNAHCSTLCSCPVAAKFMLWASQVKTELWHGGTTHTHIWTQRHNQKIFLLDLDYFSLVAYTSNWILPITCHDLNLLEDKDRKSITLSVRQSTLWAP